MQLKSVRVEGLFGAFDHHVPLDFPDRITLVYGPNGIGKTRLLKLLKALFSAEFGIFRRTPFSLFEVEFQDGSLLTLTRRALGQPDQAKAEISVAFRDGGRRRTHVLRPLNPGDFHFPISYMERRLDQLERVEPGVWWDRSQGDLIDFEEVVERYGEQLPMPPGTVGRTFPDWLAEVIARVSLRLIETQRLTASPAVAARTRKEASHAVSAYSDHLISTIRSELAKSAAISQELDRTFPSRLLKQALPKQATEATIRTKYKIQSHFRQRLMNAGLIDRGMEIALPEKRLNPTDRRVLWPYLDDVDKKLRVFGSLLEKVELLKSIINSSFLRKDLIVDARRGFVIETEDGATVPAVDLSSGEQHELVLTYQLLFLAAPQSLILIDEPEISLHVSWQHKFLEDLRQISELNDLNFLIATHSPQLIHKRVDLAVSLEPTDVV